MMLDISRDEVNICFEYAGQSISTPAAAKSIKKRRWFRWKTQKNKEKDQTYKQEISQAKQT